MEGKWFLWTAVAVLIVICLAVPAVSASNAEEINASVTKGLVWLAAQQNADGSWGGGSQVAHTGLALVKMEERAFELGKDPFDPTYLYSNNVKNGLTYIFKQVQADGSIYDNGAVQTYETGIAMMAIAESHHPEAVVNNTGNPNADGKTYKQIVEGAVNGLVGGQNPDGGWRYTFNSGSSDNSVSGYATLGLIYAKNLFGVTIPTATLQNLDQFATNIQGADGGSQYTIGGGWENILKTGNLLFEQKMVGYASDDPKVQAAISYIGAHWNDANSDPGWSNNYQAAFTTMKGLQSYDVEMIMVGGNLTDWFDISLSTALINAQNPDGSWPADTWGGSIMTTDWALLALERKIEIPVTFEVVKSASAAVINPGDTVTYTYLVKNTGIANIRQIVLTDNKLGVIAGPAGGDANSDTLLNPTETWTYTKSTTLQENTTNTATASGVNPTNNKTVSTEPSNPVTVVVAQQTRTTEGPGIVLSPGWNFVSVPRTLETGNNTAIIFKDVNTAAHTIWLYDASGRRWTAMTATTKVRTLDGIWIYAVSLTKVPLRFTQNPIMTPPTKILYQGWNAIGFSDMVPASARATLLSVKNDWTSLMGYDAENQQYEIQIINGEDGSHSETKEMIPFKGYWLFMTGDNELAAISG